MLEEFFFKLLLNLPFVPPNVLRFPPQKRVDFFSPRPGTTPGSAGVHSTAGVEYAAPPPSPRPLYADTTSSSTDKSSQYSGKIIAAVSLTVDPRSRLSEGLGHSGRRGRPGFPEALLALHTLTHSHTHANTHTRGETHAHMQANPGS